MTSKFVSAAGHVTLVCCVAANANTNTKSLAKEFSEILIFEYFGYLRIGFDVFFDADSESPRMT